MCSVTGKACTCEDKKRCDSIVAVGDRVRITRDGSPYEGREGIITTRAYYEAFGRGGTRYSVRVVGQNMFPVVFKQGELEKVS